MRVSTRFVLAIYLLAALGCSSGSPQRAARPAFKGIELYSWKADDGSWRFSLLPGTNRQKPVSEITEPEVTIVGVDNLKQRLSALARGESVLWSNLAGEPVPREVVDDLDRLCRGLDIKLDRQ
jgi:hypothetical protein